MDIKQIEKLMAAMGRNGMKKMVIKQEGIEIELEKESPPIYAVGAVTYTAPAPTLSSHREPEAITEQPKTASGKFITSPMIGTFYASPSPDASAFVKVGDRVEEGKVVGIVEAMKVMNEIKAQVGGTIAEILVKNGDPVEFGTKLFRVT